MQAAVVIVGSDPVGSLLAAELRLSGIEVVLLEQIAPERHDPAGPHVERLLDRARRLGAEVRPDCRLVGLAQVRSGVQLLLAGSGGRLELRASYLVGCDGSTVRRLAGVAAGRVYRRGRILFAGEACHSSRPPGPRRLRQGLQDALDLAWKLAAAVQGWAPDGLLDSYQAERRPVRLSHRQEDAPDGTPLRTLGELAVRPAADQSLARLIHQPDVRYELSAGRHALLGLPMPGWQLGFSDDSTVRVTELLRPGRGLLISTDRSRQVNRLAADWVDRIDIVTGCWVGRTTPATGSVLIRPDGHVAWASPDGGDLDRSLRRWFGPPQPVLARPAGLLAANW